MQPYWRVTLYYLILGVLWIFFSDRFLAAITPSAESLTFLQTIKGWLFVAASSALIFHLTRRDWRRLVDAETEKRLVFNRTVDGVHHIVLNYLNQMQLVTMEAEKCRDFDPDTLKLACALTEEASAAIARLGAIKNPDPGVIAATTHRDVAGSGA